MFLLKKEIKKLQAEDLVGRETYHKDDIENILLPNLTKEIQEKVKRKKDLQEKIKKYEEEVKKLDEDD